MPDRLQVQESSMAGIRDASWYAYPRHDHGRRSTWQPVYHVEDEAEVGTPACAPGRALLEEETMRPAREIPKDARCRRPACRKRWTAADLDSRGSERA